MYGEDWKATMLASSKLIPELLKPETALNAPTHLGTSLANPVQTRVSCVDLPWIQAVALRQVSTIVRNPCAHTNRSKELPSNKV